MTRRVCLVAVANDFLPIFLERLPKDVAVNGKLDFFDRAITTVRIEGPGLPEWCSEPSNGGKYVIAEPIIGGDGIMRIIKQDNEWENAKANFERIIEQYGNQN
jgi:hypothetical protein